MTREEFIARGSVAAVVVERSLGCPAEMMFAQAALESDWGRSAPGLNFFGYKDYPGSYGRQLLKTHEWFTDQQASDFATADPFRSIEKVKSTQMSGGKNLYAVTDWFATFPSLESCFAKRAQRWNAGANLPWVKVFKASRDWAAMFSEMAKSYSTSDPQGYADSLMGILASADVQDGLAKARAPEMPT